MSSLGHLMKHLSGSVAVQHPTLSIKTLYSGAQYLLSDAKDTLISDLNEQSVQTEDTSVKIGFKSHFKPPCHEAWI